MPILRNIIASISPRDRVVQRLYDHCVAAARDAEHYGPGRVADTVDGRFDLLVVHLFLVAHRVARVVPGGNALVRSLIEAFIRDMERNLREMGAGDIGVAKRIKYMAQALHGQMQAYGRALDDGPDALRDVLARSVLAGSQERGAADGGVDGGVDSVGPNDAAARLTAYVLAQVETLAAQPDAACLAASCRLLSAADAYRKASSECR